MTGGRTTTSAYLNKSKQYLVTWLARAFNIMCLEDFGDILSFKVTSTVVLAKLLTNLMCYLGEPVNLREQQDAVEFFMSLVESLDEALKSLGHEQIMSKILGGSFSDQKICKGCPHRYSKEEPFSVISVDIRNHSSLPESMEQYVKGN